MNAVVFTLDPPYELVIISAVCSVCVISLLVVKRRHFLTDVFIEDEDYDEVKL